MELRIRKPARYDSLVRLCAGLVLTFGALAGCELRGSPTPSDADTSDSGHVDGFAPDGDDSGPSTREVGDECDAPNQCGSEASCIGNPADTYRCMRNCEKVWSLCEDGSVCTPVANGAPICYTGGETVRGELCQSNLDCESGLLCVGTEGEPHYCVEACHADEGGCSGEDYCKAFGNSGKGYCRHRVGASCTSGSDCLGDLVCTTELDPPVSNVFPSGYCTKSGCQSDDDCPGSARCRTYPDTSISICFTPCEHRSDCRLAGQYACLDDAACRDSGGADACNSFRADANICVPPDLRSWNDG